MKTAVLSFGDRGAVERLAEAVRSIGDHHPYEAVETLTLSIYDAEGALETVIGYHNSKSFISGELISAYASIGHFKKTPLLSRGTLYWSLWVAFEFLKLKVIIASCGAHNTRSQRFLKLMGFVQTGITSYGFDGEIDLWEYELKREDAKWWPNGKIYTQDFPMLTALNLSRGS